MVLIILLVLRSNGLLFIRRLRMRIVEQTNTTLLSTDRASKSNQHQPHILVRTSDYDTISRHGERQEDAYTLYTCHLYTFKLELNSTSLFNIKLKTNPVMKFTFRTKNRSQFRIRRRNASTKFGSEIENFYMYIRAHETADYRVRFEDSTKYIHYLTLPHYKLTITT